MPMVLIVVIAWLYVAVMMAVAEATNPIGSVLGAVLTFLLYGVLPVALVLYLLSTPARRRRLRAREAAERAAAMQRAGDGQGPAADSLGAAAPGPGRSAAPDAGGEAPADAIAPVRKEP